jgi:PAS domain-containing protein
MAHQSSSSPLRAFYIARPGRDVVSGEWVIAISKAVRDRQGNLRGVCIVTVALNTFTSVFSGLLPARFSSIELYRRDGVRLVSTVPNRPRDLTGSEKDLFKDHIPAAPSGVYRVTSTGADQPGTDNLFAYRVLQRYPVVVSATADWDRLLERWRDSSMVLIASALFGILVIATLTAWVIRRIGAEKAVQRALVTSEHSLMESQRLSGIGYFERSVYTELATWSPLMYAIHGVNPETFTPDRESFRALIVDEDQPKVTAAWQAVDHGKTMNDVECRITTPGGSVRHIRYAWKILEDGNGPPRVFGVA